MHLECFSTFEMRNKCSPAARVFTLSESLATSRVHAILNGKRFSIPLIPNSPSTAY